MAGAKSVNQSIDARLRAKLSDSMSVCGTHRTQNLLGLDAVDGFRLDKVCLGLGR